MKISNKELLAEIIKSKAQDKLTPRALELLIALAKKASTKLPYTDPDDRKDCIASAYEDIWKYWRGFNPDKGTNAFAYYTSLVKKGFAKGWNNIHPKKAASNLRIDGAKDSEGIYTI